MQTQTSQGPWWAALTVWAVVNAVNVLQSAGFLSRIPTGSMAINRLLGYVMIALAVPAALALFAFVRAQAGWQQWIGPAVYIAFIALMIVVDYVSPVEFRSPPRYGILVPYLMLFFGSILLMGMPMFRLNRGLWLVTVASTVLLLSSMCQIAAVGDHLFAPHRVPFCRAAGCHWPLLPDANHIAFVKMIDVGMLSWSSAIGASCKGETAPYQTNMLY